MAEHEPAPPARSGSRYGSTHFWTVVGSAAGVVGAVVALIFGIAQCSGPDSAEPPIPPSPSTPPPSATTATPTTTVEPPLAQGHAKLINVEGIDLDNGQVRDQNVPGVDMSPSKTADSLNAMTDGNARFAVPQDRTRTGADRCAAIPTVSWTQTLDDVYHLTTGSHLCVQTDQGNLADLTLTHIPSAAEQYLEFDFVTRRGG
ncbi:hypothetical protein [Nocardia brasiliensis]|uniref:hypothetical protein n=1 Tax=Nocardia brasiliensis TaxID=37326 RepID=UPI0004A6BF1A|nr:hypothetical protein [Nocardia brasiliensis]